MAKDYVGDWCREYTNTIGTGNIALIGELDGNSRFVNAINTGHVWYTLEDGSNRESGVGTFDGTNTIERTTIHTTLVNGTYNDTSPPAISLTGNAIVSCTMTSESYLELHVGVVDLNASLTTTDNVLTNHTSDQSVHFLVSSIALGDLGDVSLTTSSTGDVLVYDGTNWVNLPTGTNNQVLTATSTGIGVAWKPTPQSYFYANSIAATPTVTGDDAIGIGGLAAASGESSIAIGHDAGDTIDSGITSICIGAHTRAHNTNSVAIGHGISTTTSDTANVGSSMSNYLTISDFGRLSVVGDNATIVAPSYTPANLPPGEIGAIAYNVTINKLVVFTGSVWETITSV